MSGGLTKVAYNCKLLKQTSISLTVYSYRYSNSFQMRQKSVHAKFDFYNVEWQNISNRWCALQLLKQEVSVSDYNQHRAWLSAYLFNLQNNTKACNQSWN